MGRPRELTEAERRELLAQGWRPVQAEIWVPDGNNPDFLARMKQDCAAINDADRRSGELDRLSDEVAGLSDDLPL